MSITAPILDRPATATESFGIVDCDIHPAQKHPSELFPYLSERWREHMVSFGSHYRQPFAFGLPYPRFGDGNRVDARTPDGSYGGSDLAFMQQQHLDPNNIAYGVLQPLGPNAISQRNQGFAAALCSAVNDWQLESWCRRSRGSRRRWSCRRRIRRAPSARWNAMPATAISCSSRSIRAASSR